MVHGNIAAFVEVAASIQKEPFLTQQSNSIGSKGSSLLRSGLVVSVLLLFAKLTGMGRDIVMAAVFGVGPEMQAYAVATIASGFLVSTLMMGSLSGAMIPAYTQRCIQGTPYDGFVYWRAIGRRLGIVIVALSAMHYLLAETAVGLLGPGLEPDTAAKAVEMARLFSLGIPLSFVAGWLTVLLHAHRRFVAVGLRSAMVNLALIVAVWYFVPSLGAWSLVIGTLVGNFIEILLQLPFALQSYRRHWQSDASPSAATPALAPCNKEFLRDYLPLVTISVLLNWVTVLDRSYSTLVVAAGAAVLMYAERLIEIARAMVGRTVATILLPELASVSSDCATNERLTQRSLSVVTVLTVPIAIGLYFFGDAIAYVAFLGRIDGEDVATLHLALKGLAPTAVFFPLLWVQDRIFAGHRCSGIFLACVATGVGINWIFKASLSDPTLSVVTFGSSIGLGIANVLAIGYLQHRFGKSVLSPFYRDLWGALLCFGSPIAAAFAAMSWGAPALLAELPVSMAIFVAASVVGAVLFWILDFPMCSILPLRKSGADGGSDSAAEKEDASSP